MWRITRDESEKNGPDERAKEAGGCDVDCFGHVPIQVLCGRRKAVLMRELLLAPLNWAKYRHVARQSWRRCVVYGFRFMGALTPKSCNAIEVFFEQPGKHRGHKDVPNPRQTQLCRKLLRLP